MKSSKDVPTRVGMQFTFDNIASSSQRRRKITKVVGSQIFTDVDSPDHPGQLADIVVWYWGNYEIEWIPPTDEERRMLKRAADHVRTGKGECQEYCEWEYWFETGATIADSLALDGADCDNMPAGYR